MYAIQETFQEYDINGDGGISIAEMTELVRARTLERKKTIQDKFDAFVNDEGVLEDEVRSLLFFDHYTLHHSYNTISTTHTNHIPIIHHYAIISTGA